MSRGFDWGDARADAEPDWVTGTIEDRLVAKAVQQILIPEQKPFDKYYHPSRIYDMCPVCEYYVRRDKPIIVDEPELRMSGMAAAGTRAHHYFQDCVLGPAGLLKGLWRCKICNRLHSSTPSLYPRTHCSGSCDCNEYRYVEPSLRDEEHLIIGHTDGIVPFEGEDYLLEAKSKSAKAYPEYNKPSKKERLQASLYMDIAGVERCIYMFICRDDYAFKFVIGEKDQGLVDEAHNSIASIEEALVAGEVTSALKVFKRCASTGAARFKKCPFREECKRTCFGK